MGKEILNRRQNILADSIPPEIVDTSSFIEATDYATSTTGGTIKVDSTYAIELTSGGKLKAKEIAAEDYSAANDAAFISKGTLDNVLAGYSSTEEYSTTEHVVAKWVDGSDVYEKTFVATNVAYTTAYTYQSLGTIPDLALTISVEGTLKNASGTNWIGSAFVDNTGKSSCFFVRKIDDVYNAVFVSADTWDGSDMYVTVRYTKVTTP